MDREEQTSYTVTITATDQDPDEDTRRSNSVPATIIGTLITTMMSLPLHLLPSNNGTVLDVNDNSPQFSEDMYEFSIAENTATVELPITASDGDDGTNEDIVYEIINGSTNNAFLISECT